MKACHRIGNALRNLLIGVAVQPWGFRLYVHKSVRFYIFILMFQWSADFQKELVHLRKFALRSGVLADEHASYNLKPDVVKRLLAGKLSTDELTETDFILDMKQKGADMRIGIDIASMSIKHLVDRIILIAGDSDFVPAAKMARRECIDFILDPMWAPIRADLFEHIDGLRAYALRASR